MCNKKINDNYCKKCKNLMILCDICKKPITKSNKYGMFCKNMCGLKEAKEEYVKLTQFIDQLNKLEY